jgi:hemerythrin-like domain-containing protein
MLVTPRAEAGTATIEGAERVAASAPDDVHLNRPDTHQMVVIHRAFRRESAMLAALIAQVPAGATDRVRVLADHFRWYRLGLHNHHHGEDELIWPLLLSRADLEADIVLRMEAQHERISSTLARAEVALSTWEAAAAEPARDELVAALADHRDVLLEHVDDEETELLPLAARHLSAQEWAAQGEHFMQNTPKTSLLIFLGAVLEDADAGERAAFLAAMPLVVRVIWHVVGRPVYARRMKRIRAGRRLDRDV